MMTPRIVLLCLAFAALSPGMGWAATDPLQPPLPEVPPDLKAEVEALKKPIHKFTAHCYSRPIDRSDTAVPDDCAKLEKKLDATLKAAKPEAVLHAIFRHGVLYLVRAAADSDPYDRVWQGDSDANARLLASYVASGDAHTVAQYAIHAMRIAQRDDGGDADYSSARDRVMWLAWLVARATQAPYPALKGVWDVDHISAAKVALRWREWWATKQDKSSEELRKLGLAEALAALGDADPGVRLWAAQAVFATQGSPARLLAVWTVREALLDSSLSKAAATAFAATAHQFPALELLAPAPLAGKVATVPNPAPALVQDPNDPLEQGSAAVPLPPVPPELKETVARLVPLYRQMASKCWADEVSEYGDDWTGECFDAIEQIRGGEPETLQPARMHAAARGLFAPLAEGKVKTPKKTKALGPVSAAYVTLDVTSETASLMDQIVAHTASIALARATWTAGDQALLQDFTSNFSKDGLGAAALAVPWAPAPPNALRASLQRQVAAWNLRSALAKDHKGKAWTRLSQQLARSGNLASRYRFACQPYWVDTKAERAEAVRLVRQVLFDPNVPATIRQEFLGGPCSELNRPELLVGSPWPAPAMAQGLVATAAASEAAAPLSCRAALQGWYAGEAVKACGAAVGEGGEPRPEALWAQLDAGEDPTRVQALVEPWLPRLQGPTLDGFRELWAAAATAAGQRQPVADRLAAWLGDNRTGGLADRLALLQGKPASAQWWLTAATGAACVARHGHSADAAWLARRGWIAGAPAFAKAVVGLSPAMRREVVKRSRAVCPITAPIGD